MVLTTTTIIISIVGPHTKYLMTKILICGDSFASDWSQHDSSRGWTNLLSDCYAVTNLAQAGCSEYKIYLQLKSVNLSDFDVIIVAHTSPNRLYTKTHPVHHSGMHVNSDLIYADIKEHSKNDPKLSSIVDYFEHDFDLEYAEFIHTLTCKEIDQLLTTHNVIHVTGFDWTGLYKFTDLISFFELAQPNKGYANHFSEFENQTVYNIIKDRLDSVC